MRMRKKPWAENELLTNDLVIKDTNINWNNEFKGDCIHIEIGTGKGKFILENAINNANINFIGIEKQESVLAVAARAAKQQNIENVRFISIDAQNIQQIFDKKQISAIYINFCDPWEKKKYSKRRLTHRNFLSSYRNIIKNDGILIFKTDNENLFNFSLNELIESKWKIENVSRDLHTDILNGQITGNVMTEYEEKFVSSGKKIYSIYASVPDDMTLT